MRVDRSINALNGHLHDQLAKLLNPDISNEDLEVEIKRSKAISNISSQILEGERVLNERARIIAEHRPKMLEGLLGIGVNENTKTN